MALPLTPCPPAAALSLIAAGGLECSVASPAVGAVTLAPHQVDAVGRLLPVIEACGGALLADAPGMGKTFVALAVAARFRDVAVVAPASLRAMWTRAFDRAGVCATFHSIEAMARAGWRAPAAQPRFVIVDEAHHVRNPHTRRYDALAALTMGARVLLLSATPLHNDGRDLAALFALFLGSAAGGLDAGEIGRMIVRRRRAADGTWRSLPGLEPLRWLPVPDAGAVLDALLAIPPAVPGADGRTAHALMVLGLLRAFASSDAALRLTLRRRALRATAIAAILDAGRWPSRRDLTAWTSVDGALQLAFTELLVPTGAPAHRATLRAGIARHLEGIARVRALLDGNDDRDAVRVAHLRRLRRRHPDVPIVAFTAFADTARAFYGRLRTDAGVALVTARGARIASGPVGREEVLHALDPWRARPDSLRGTISLLLATDVLSEGIDLQQAGVVVHLDLPWTAARLEQRVGRLLRPGGPNEHVFAYALGPPGGLRRLRPVRQALRRKARLMRRLGDDSALDAHASLLDTAAPEVRARSGHTGDPPRQVEALRARLVALCAQAVSVPDESGAVAWIEVPEHQDRWTALALATVGGMPRLVVLSPAGAADSPRRVARALDTIHRSPPTGPSGETPPHVARALDEATARAARWLGERRAAGMLLAALRSPSAEHRRALREIDRLVAGVARHCRPTLAVLAGTARSLVLGAHGAGAERALSRWLGAGSAGDAVAARSRLDALATFLAPCAPGLSLPSSAPDHLRALLVIVRAHEGA